MLYVREQSVVNVTSIDGISLHHMYTHVLLFAEFISCCYTLDYLVFIYYFSPLLV